MFSLNDSTRIEYPLYSIRIRTKSTPYKTCNVCTKPTTCRIPLNRKPNYFSVEVSRAWLYDCPHFLSLLYEADRCFHRIPIHFKDTLKYVDPITQQTYDYATPITCDNNPRNIIELDPDSDEQNFTFLDPNQ